jgi:hypothetical protein
MEMRAQSLHGDAVGGGSDCIRGEGVKRSLQSPDIESGSFRPRSGQVGAPAVRKGI